jgi:hypothetical protein
LEHVQENIHFHNQSNQLNMSIQLGTVPRKMDMHQDLWNGHCQSYPKSSIMDHYGISPAIGLKIGDGASTAMPCQVAGIGRITTWHRTSDQLPLQGHGFLPAATLLAGTAGSTQCPNASDSGHEEISQDLQSTPG